MVVDQLSGSRGLRNLSSLINLNDTRQRLDAEGQIESQRLIACRLNGQDLSARMMGRSARSMGSKLLRGKTTSAGIHSPLLQIYMLIELLLTNGVPRTIAAIKRQVPTHNL